MSAECHRCGSDLPFEGDCERCQFKDERDRLRADLSSLRAAVEAEVERLREEAGHQAVLQDWAEELKRPEVAAAHGGWMHAYDRAADCLQALLPDTSRDRGEGT